MKPSVFFSLDPLEKGPKKTPVAVDSVYGIWDGGLSLPLLATSISQDEQAVQTDFVRHALFEKRSSAGCAVSLMSFMTSNLLRQ